MERINIWMRLWRLGLHRVECCKRKPIFRLIRGNELVMLCCDAATWLSMRYKWKRR